MTVSDIVKCMTNVSYVEPQSLANKALFTMAAQASSMQSSATKTTVLVQAADTLVNRPLTMTGVSQPAATSLLAAGATDATRPVSLLVIETGPITYTGKFTIRVFVNKPDADRQTSTRDPHYVGRVRVLDSEARANEAGADARHTFSVMILPAQSNMYNQVKPGAQFSVTLVPIGPSTNDDTFRIPVRSISLKSVGGAR